MKQDSKLEARKEFERKAFNKGASDFLLNTDSSKWDYGARSGYSSEFNNLFLSAPYIYIEERILRDLEGKRILDYCCGTGDFSIYPALNGAFVEGIDISDVSIEIAEAKARYWKVSEKTNFQVMDAENLQFNDDTFDMVLSYGSLSYLNLTKAAAEFCRVIKPSGTVVIVDTLGHNPIMNYNRKKYVKKGLRQQYHYDHILKNKDIKYIKSCFGKAKVRYFDLLTIPVFLFKNIPGIRIFKITLEKLDSIILKTPYLNLFAFKVVITLSNPKKKMLNANIITTR